MQKLINRNIETFVTGNINVFPAVAILGPRQCGKSTLVKMLYQNSDAYLYLDLQNLDDLNKLREPMLFFKLIKMYNLFDEIQLVPELISVLRSEIDRHRRPGRFICLDLLRRTL
jgi:predicted AAA+ superfamily ATPase